MNIGKLFFPLIFLFHFDISFNYDQIAQISIPKTGTGLLGKCIVALTGRMGVIDSRIEPFEYNKLYVVNINEAEILTNLGSDGFWGSHLYYSKFYADFLKKKNVKTIFLYRDPRDHLISMAFYILSLPLIWPEAQEVSFDALIMDLITKGDLLNNFPPATLNMRNFYEKYIGWIDEPHVLSIRFEDLIGPNGGGDLQIQLQTIKRIADHIDIVISDEKLHSIADSLFGGTQTFRQGKIGAWKEYFSKEHINAFKEMAGDLLIKLRYEKDFNW